MWGPPSGPRIPGRCIPAGGIVTLTQGGPDAAGAPAVNGERVVSTHDLGGTIATYAEGGVSGSRRLTWTSAEAGFVLAWMSGCEGDEPMALEDLLRLARSLV
jgi:hypothetical protein